MRLLTLITAIALLIAAVPARAGLIFADLDPVKGDSGTYSISEETAMGFEGTPVTAASTGSGQQTSEVVAVSRGGGTTVYVVLSAQTMKRTRTPSGSEDTSTSHSLEVCRATKRGLYLDKNISIEDGEDDSVDVGATLLEIRLPCAPGTSWGIGRLGFQDGFSLRPQATATAYETVKVPAGTFENCLKVIATCPSGIEGYLQQGDQRLEIVSGDLHAATWYYPRVGIVKEVVRSSLRLRPEGQVQMIPLRMDTMTTTELTTYKLGKP
ncbi:MAG: hypothetical protein HYX78_02720 [Armatimonadetes bacterium]|nr:hypothetical protein [Armatimonadota bacterium]